MGSCSSDTNLSELHTKVVASCLSLLVLLHDAGEWTSMRQLVATEFFVEVSMGISVMHRGQYVPCTAAHQMQCTTVGGAWHVCFYLVVV